MNRRDDEEWCNLVKLTARLGVAVEQAKHQFERLSTALELAQERIKLLEEGEDDEG